MRKIAAMFLLPCGLLSLPSPCAAEANQVRVGVVLYSADWCSPCRSLKAELAEQSDANKLVIRIDGVTRTVDLTIVDLTSASESQRAIAGKMLPYFPEEAIVIDQIVVARDSYSDLDSLRMFVEKTLTLHNR